MRRTFVPTSIKIFTKPFELWSRNQISERHTEERTAFLHTQILLCAGDKNTWHTTKSIGLTRNEPSADKGLITACIYRHQVVTPLSDYCQEIKPCQQLQPRTHQCQHYRNPLVTRPGFLHPFNEGPSISSFAVRMIRSEKVFCPSPNGQPSSLCGWIL